jgi:hypothetical protein
MKEEQKQSILEAWAYCDEYDKSTEFMLAYMSDVSGVDFDAVVDYVCSDESSTDRDKYYEDIHKKDETCKHKGCDKEINAHAQNDAWCEYHEKQINC